MLFSFLVPAALLLTALAVQGAGTSTDSGNGCGVPYPNPLSSSNIPDPSVLREGGLLYVYGTGHAPGGGVYPIRVSPAADRTSWTQIGAIFSRGNYPPWAGRRSYWAPEVHRVQGRYICYFSTRDRTGRFRIGAATAPSPAGPFTPQPRPLVSDPEVGLIDPSWFRDQVTGRSFLLWKEDANDLQPPRPTGIMLQELEPHGLALKGKPRRLIVNDSPWEGVLVEAPSLIYRRGYYYLFYSGNVYADDRYGVGVARSRSVEGPYEKFSRNPILRSSRRFDGPGHQFLFEESPECWTLFYHARDRKDADGSSSRLLMSDPVHWRPDGWPAISDGTPGERAGARK